MKLALALVGAAGLLALAAPHRARADSVTRDPNACSVSIVLPGGYGFPFLADKYGNLCVNVAVGGGGGGGGTVTIPTGIPPYQGTSVPTDQLGVSTASAVAVNAPATSTYCVVTAAVASVNWRADGTNPTTGASGGQPLGPGQFMYVSGPNLLSTMKFINNTAASGALLNISCFK